MATEDINFNFEKATNDIVTNGYAYLYSASKEAKEQRINYPIHLFELGLNCGRFLIETIGEEALQQRILVINEMGEKLIPSLEKQQIAKNLWHPRRAKRYDLFEGVNKTTLSVKKKDGRG